MTGKIKTLSASQRSGSIETLSKLSYAFDWSAVLAYDAGLLVQGLPVTFDLNSSAEAVNICVHKAPRPIVSDGKKKEFTFRYIGFDQSNGIRTHRFERWEGQHSTLCAVHTDTSLFAKLHVGIQEGPTLCLRLLTVPPEPNGDALQAESSLTEAHLMAYLESKPSPARRSPPKRVVRQD